MMPIKLTDAIAASSAIGTQWDEEVTGFGLRVSSPTSRSFFLNYRMDGRERRFTIGKFPTWSTSRARAEARDLRRRVDRGDDPAALKRESREAPTVADLAVRYEREHLPNKSPRTQYEDKQIITREILPRLGRRKVSSVHSGDIGEMHREIRERAPVRANRVVSVASRMFSLSLKSAAGEQKPWRDAVQGNPCKGLELSPEEGRERFFSARELAAISDALAAYPGLSVANCIRFVMLTGCRPSEASLATWEQVETEPGFWVKPSAHTKQRKTHRVPLTPPALELLAALDRSERGNVRWLFPGADPAKPVRQLFYGWRHVRETASVSIWEQASSERITSLIEELRNALGRTPLASECIAHAKIMGVDLPSALMDTRIYDLRHTFASIGASNGLGLPVIGRLLGHTQSRTTQRYVHLSDDPMRDAADQIAAVINRATKSRADHE